MSMLPFSPDMMRCVAYFPEVQLMQLIAMTSKCCHSVLDSLLHFCLHDLSELQALPCCSRCCSLSSLRLHMPAVGGQAQRLLAEAQFTRTLRHFPRNHQHYQSHSCQGFADFIQRQL